MVAVGSDTVRRLFLFLFSQQCVCVKEYDDDGILVMYKKMIPRNEFSYFKIFYPGTSYILLFLTRKKFRVLFIYRIEQLLFEAFPNLKNLLVVHSKLRDSEREERESRDFQFFEKWKI